MCDEDFRGRVPLRETSKNRCFPLIRRQSAVLGGGRRIVGPVKEGTVSHCLGVYQAGGLPSEREVCTSTAKVPRSLTVGSKGEE